MCWLCDNPDATDEDYLARIRQTITRFGWAVQGVEGDRREPPWAYTVGLTEARLPELVITGLDLGECTDTLNTYAGEVVRDGPPPAGTRLTLDVGLDVEVVRVVRPQEHLFTAVDLFGGSLRALQLAWADDAGRWPWQRGFDGRQFLLGRRAA